MRFVKQGNTSLQLDVVRYQFPQSRSGYDANWLVIAGQAEQEGIRWSFEDACLLTDEVSSLAEWLEARSSAPDHASEIAFMEPNLHFAWADGKLKVGLDWNCRPVWARSNEIEEFHLSFSPSPQELANAAAALRGYLLRFPIRA